MSQIQNRSVAPANPALEWWVPVLGDQARDRVGKVIDANFPNDGAVTAMLETRIAEICKVPYAVATTSGTTAITLALMACGVGPGDEVLVPDITFIATANAVQLAGATPLLVDVELSNFNISPRAVEAAITSRTKAIIPVHVSGRGANLKALQKIAEAHHLFVVEDAAEALGSIYDGKPLGSFGDAGCFSFSANKTITTGQGGMVVTKDDDIHKRLRMLKDQGRPVRGTGGNDEHVTLGYNFKLTNLQAALGLAQLEAFEERLQHQRQMYLWYLKYMPETPNVRLPVFHVEAGECPQWIDIFVQEGRDNLDDYLLRHNIHTRKYWYALHSQAPYRHQTGDFTDSTQVASKALWLPSALTMSEDDVRYVCQVIEEWLGQNDISHD